MNKRYIILLAIAASLTAGYFLFSGKSYTNDNIIAYRADLKVQELKMYWQDENGHPFKSIANLKVWLDGSGQTLVFAMNGGMFKNGNIPQGLFVQAQKTSTPIDTATGSGNFYLKPNGIFYTTTDRTAAICKTESFTNNRKIAYATQSGPMLVMDGRLHPAFTRGSANKTVRNGVGILPDGTVVFAMSKREINFYDFATYFKNLGCRNALYLDGFVSRTFLPEKNWVQTDGDFGVIIGVTVRK